MSIQRVLTCLLLFSLVWCGCHGADMPRHQRHRLRRSWHYVSRTPLNLLNRARVVTGDDSRMTRFVEKMLRGENTSIAWLGTSLSMAYYGIPKGLSMAWPYIFHRWLELTFTPCGDPERDMPPVMEPWDMYEVNGGHVCHQSTINITNLSVFATTPNFMESCKLQKIPRNVDLVVVEMAVNDGFNSLDLDSPSRRAFERMLRYILKLPHHPALLLFQTYSWRHANRMDPPTHTGTELKKTVERYRRFAYMAEDDHMVLAQYYGNIQVLAMRPVVYHTIMAHPDKRPLDLYMPDDIHLRESGHILYADVLITYFRQYARQVAMHLDQNAHSDTPAEQSHQLLQPQDLYQQQQQQQNMTRDMLALGFNLSDHYRLHPYGRGMRAERPFGYLFPHWLARANYSYVHENYANDFGPMYQEMLEPWLPPPMGRGNYEVAQGQCYYGAELHPYVVENDGFEFKDESLSNRNKFGYVAMVPGKRLVLRVDATLGGVNKNVERSTINILHLESYEGMGMAEVACIKGCQCGPEKWDSQCERKWSYTYAKSIDVTPHPDCHLEIRTIAAPDNRSGHKVKITGIAIMGGNRVGWDLDFSLSIERYASADQLP